MHDVMPIVRAIIATILATALVAITLIAEIGEEVERLGVVDALGAEEFASIKGDVSGPFNFDSTFLLLVAAIIILVVPDAIAYFRRKQAPSPASKEPDGEVE